MANLIPRHYLIAITMILVSAFSTEIAASERAHRRPPEESARTVAERPPHYRRTPPPHYRRTPPPHYRRTPRRRVIHHYHLAPAPAPAPAPAAVRPRQPIVDPRSSIYFGIGALANMVVRGDAQITQFIKTGGGFNLFFGYRFNEYVALELGGMFSFHGTTRSDIESGTLNGFTGDVKVFVLPSSRRVEPFVQLGLGGYLFARPRFEGNELAGAGLQAGGGVDIRLNRTLAVGARLLYRGIYLDNADATYWHRYESVFMNLVTADLNLQLHF